jgi:hypothetical protein
MDKETIKADIKGGVPMQEYIETIAKSSAFSGYSGAMYGVKYVLEQRILELDKKIESDDLNAAMEAAAARAELVRVVQFTESAVANAERVLTQTVKVTITKEDGESVSG